MCPWNSIDYIKYPVTAQMKKTIHQGFDPTPENTGRFFD
jgi:hypothetical protein